MLSIEIKKQDWFTNYIYFYIFILPWHISKSQLSVTSGILLIWAIIKFKTEILLKVKEYAKFLPITLLFGFIGYALLSTLWSDPVSEGVEHFINFYKYYFLFIPALFVVLNRKLAENSIKILVISFGLYAIYSILIYFGFFNSNEYGFQSNNPTGHLRYLIVGQYMLIGFYLSILFVYFSNNKKEQGLFFIIAMLCLIGEFINNSRTAQISFIAIFILFSIMFFYKKLFNIKSVSVFLILGIFIATLFYMNKTTFDRYKKAYDETVNAISHKSFEGSFGLRIYLSKTGLEIFSDNILFGTGPKDNRMALIEIVRNDPEYKGKKSDKDLLNHFHSEQMEILTAYGLVGYSLLLFSVVFLILKLRQNPLMYYSSLVVFLSLFINSFGNKTLSLKPLNYVYIIFFILFAVIAYYESKKEKSSN